MINLRTAPVYARVAVGVALSAALSAVAIALILAVPTSAAPRNATSSTSHSVKVSGKTSQRRPISFHLTSATVGDLRYWIIDRCPHGRRLFVHSWGFPPLSITSSQFGGRFVAKPPAAATTTISGKIAGGRVTGSLSDRTRRANTRKFCTGKATFNLRIPPAKHHPAPRPAPGRHPH